MSELVSIPSPGVPIYRGLAGDPVVVVVPDWYGRLPWLETIAEALAAEGFWVVVPDLFNGVATTDDVEAEKLMAGLDIGIALAELDDVIANARSLGSTRVGMLGFSLGGWLSLLHAQSGGADAVVAYYASLAPEDHGVIPAPVQLHYAENDEWGDGEDPDDFIERLGEHGTPVDEHVYIGTEHSFANASVSRTHNPRAAELARARSAKFLAGHLFG
jgi:carboxymethylenebutenolidase